MKRGAIFDMDGTLLNTERFYTQAWVETADKFNLPRKPELAKAMSGSNIKVMPDILHSFYPDVDALQYVDTVVQFCKDKTKENLELMPGVNEILLFFKSQNISMAVASSSNKDSIIENLQRSNILSFFDAIVGGNEVSNSKPAPDIFIKAAEKLNLNPKDCYVFEDSFNGVKAGHAANCLTIMIPDQVLPTKEIKEICLVYNDLFKAKEAILMGNI